MNQSVPTPSQKSLLDRLEYQPEKGWLVWRPKDTTNDTRHAHKRSWNTCWAGERAGGLWSCQSGYSCRKLRIFGRYIAEHRLIWKMVTGREAGSHIDHINGDATDNRWHNLREVTQEENSRNCGMQKNNSTGVTGVYYFAPTGKWQAHIRVNRKKIHLGYFDEIDEAAMAVMEERERHGFTARHGIFFAPKQRHPESISME